MPVHTQWFKDRLAERRMSQRALARALKLDSAAVSLMFRGRREMRISEAIEIANLLGRTPDEVMEAAGAAVQTRGKKIPICGFIDGHGEMHNLDEPQRHMVNHPGGDLAPDIHAIQCRTAGTDLDYMDGWLLYLDSHIKEGVPAEAVGRLSLCKMHNGIVYLAKPTRGYDRGRWRLSGPAASTKDVQLKWAAPVLQILT